MRKRITIPLEGRREVHGVTFSEIVLREPNADEYLDLGEPQALQPAPRGGGAILVTYDEIVKDYIRRCVVVPDGAKIAGPDMLSELSLSEIREVRRRFLDFFSRSPDGNSEKPSSSSSGASDGSPGTSPASQ